MWLKDVAERIREKARLGKDLPQVLHSSMGALISLESWLNVNSAF
jgi:alpha-beta hydrolase superfamily lysophospholipase